MNRHNRFQKADVDAAGSWGGGGGGDKSQSNPELTPKQILTMEKTNSFHNVFKVQPKCGNTMEKLWNPSFSNFYLFCDVELKVNIELA